MFKGIICATFLSTALCVSVPLSAQAADVGFCHAYADAAVNQVRAALANRVCARRISGPRWVPEHRVHFDWCLGATVPVAEAERAARTEFLRGCRG
jgi:hypothetical protein